MSNKSNNKSDYINKKKQKEKQNNSFLKIKEKLIKKSNIDKVTTKYNQELSGTKQKFSYNLTGPDKIDHERFLELLYRKENLKYFKDLSQKYIEHHFSKNYKTNFGLPLNYSEADLPDCVPWKRDLQLYNFNFDNNNKFILEAFLTKKTLLFPAEIIERTHNDKSEKYKILTAIGKVRDQYVLFKRIIAYKNESRANAGSSDQFLMFVNGKLEGFIGLARQDFSDMGFHVNLFNDNNELERDEQIKIFSPHIHLRSELFDIVFPAKLNSCDAVEVKCKTFNEINILCDNFYNIEDTTDTIFPSREKSSGHSYIAAYDTYIKQKGNKEVSPNTSYVKNVKALLSFICEKCNNTNIEENEK